MALHAVEDAIKLKLEKAGKSVDDLSIEENQLADPNQPYLHFECRHYSMCLRADGKPTRFLTVTRTGALSVDIRFMKGPVLTIRRYPVDLWKTDPWVYVYYAGRSHRLTETMDPYLFDQKLRDHVCEYFKG